MTTRTHRDAPRGGFTLVELLVVMGIIAILAALTVGVATQLRRGTRRDSTRILLQKVQTAMDEHKTQVGEYPEEIPTADQIATQLNNGDLVSDGGDSDSYHVAGLLRQGNRAVANIAFELDEFSTSGGGTVPELVEAGGQYYLVDSYFGGSGDMGMQAVDTNNDGNPDTLGHRILGFVREGHNRPALDIWSTGPNGVNNALGSYPSGNPQAYGDDIVSWAGEGQ